MSLSDLSIKRPVVATVMSLLLIAFGLVSFYRTPLREYPDIDPPVVSIETSYPGAASSIVETRITKLLEDRIAGVEGINFIESKSEEGRSTITVQFISGLDVSNAANDIRDRVFGVLDELPDEAEPPEIRKVDSNDDVIVWFNLEGDSLTIPELTDYAERYLIDRFSALPGVARVRVGGGQRFAARIWLDRLEMAARNLSVREIEDALRRANVEIPAGSIESQTIQFSVVLDRVFKTPESLTNLVVSTSNGALVKLSDIASVQRSTEEDRSMFRGNGVPMVGVGIVKQSTANTISVAKAAQELRERINTELPDGMELKQSYDSSVFVSEAVNEVYNTLFMAAILVMAVMYFFLRDFRATIIPAVTVPISIIATFIALDIFGFSINILTLLALVLAIGLVVDDAIVVLENIARRMAEYRESALVAAYRGTNEVFFAVIATTIVLVSVFTPLTFLTGDLGRLFSEFALTMSAAVIFSTFVALSFSPMIASKFLKPIASSNEIKNAERFINLGILNPKRTLTVALALVPICFLLIWMIPSEYAPREDRGAFFVLVNGPEGATYSYTAEAMAEVEEILLPYVENGEVNRLLVRAPRSFGGAQTYNTGIVITTLNSFDKRRSAFDIMDEVQKKLSSVTNVRAFPVMRQGFGRGIQKPVQVVIGGSSYEELVKWREILLTKINQTNPGLEGIDWDYKETKPEIRVQVDYEKAEILGVTVEEIGRSLETLLGSKRVTTYIENGEEYDIILEGMRTEQRTPQDMLGVYVKGKDSLVPLSSLISYKEVASSPSLNRFNRTRAITLEANLTEDLSLGAALDYLEELIRDNFPATVEYKGQSRDFKTSSGSVLFVFLFGIVIVYLVLAAQFESFIHPWVILLTVPVAVFGGLVGLLITGGSLNIYSQVGLVVLVGLAAKNGILIVEFANQLRERGLDFYEAVNQATKTRLRPILMTGITTVAGAVPLVITSGAGSETRAAVGVVLLFGVAFTTLFTPLVIPAAYLLMAKNTGTPGDVAKKLENELAN